MSLVHLDAQLTAVLRSHSSLERLHNQTWHRSIVGEGFGTIMHGNPSGFAEELVVSRFVTILETAPAADVVNEDGPVGRYPCYDISQQLAKACAAAEYNSALCSVRIGLDDGKTLALGVLLNGSHLVLQRVLLVLGGHS